MKNNTDQIQTDQIQDRIESNLKDYAHWLGGWDALRELIKVLQENEEEAAFDRHNNKQ